MWSGRVDVEHLYLSDVFGFVRLSIQCGSPLVPVYTFGESLSMGPDWYELGLSQIQAHCLPPRS